MAEHTATIEWNQPAEDFLRGKYSREHTWAFDGGLTVTASPSPAVVPAPWSNPDHVDPEEAYVASLSSCHMLTFLHVASRKGFVVERYVDQAVGTTAKNDKGAFWVDAVTLNPQITYTGDKSPTPEEEQDLHHLAHEHCFIANSVKTEVTVARPA